MFEECIVCSSNMKYAFSKDFGSVAGLHVVDYWVCISCGFMQSKTHAEMADGEWEELNREYHKAYQGTDQNVDDPRWLQRLACQASVIDDICQIGLLPNSGSWLDYACGDGRLSYLLNSRYKLSLLKYDKYMLGGDDYLDSANLREKGFDFVITTSVMEHLRFRNHLNSIESLVSPNGVLGLHTLVCERVPQDADWFYLLPVHCSFFSNKSMSVLFEQWGYTSSIYNVEARLWFWFRGDLKKVEDGIKAANARPNGHKYIFKQGFMDYWK